jgi:hypothetical protein
MGDIRRRKNFYKGTALIGEAERCGLTDQWKIHVHSDLLGNRTLDFAPFRRKGREDLARHFRDAVWLERNKLSVHTLGSFMGGLRVFYRFLDESRAHKGVTRLKEVDRALLLEYVGWLKKHFRGSRNRAWIYAGLKSVLAKRAIMVPCDVHADLREERFPKNLFPNSQHQSAPRLPYREGEESRIGAAIGEDLRSMAAGEWGGIDADIVAVVVLALAHRTALNPSVLLGLREDCLVPHPENPNREVLITYKRRGYTLRNPTPRRRKRVVKGKGNRS